MGDTHKEKEANKSKPLLIPKNQFYLQNGKTLNSLKELKISLSTMDENTFSHHVNSEKNDFSNWIRNSLENPKLADEINSVKNKNEAIKIVGKYIKPATKPAKTKTATKPAQKKAVAKKIAPPPQKTQKKTSIQKTAIKKSPQKTTTYTKRRPLPQLYTYNDDDHLQTPLSQKLPENNPQPALQSPQIETLPKTVQQTYENYEIPEMDDEEKNIEEIESEVNQSPKQDFNDILKKLEDEDKLLDLEMNSIKKSEPLGFDQALKTMNKEIPQIPVNSNVPPPNLQTLQSENINNPTMPNQLPDFGDLEPPLPPTMDETNNLIAAKPEQISSSPSQQIDAKPLPTTQTQKKRGFFSKIFGKKEEQKTEETIPQLQATPEAVMDIPAPPTTDLTAQARELSEIPSPQTLEPMIANPDNTLQAKPDPSLELPDISKIGLDLNLPAIEQKQDIIPQKDETLVKTEITPTQTKSETSPITSNTIETPQIADDNDDELAVHEKELTSAPMSKKTGTKTSKGKTSKDIETQENEIDTIQNKFIEQEKELQTFKTQGLKLEKPDFNQKKEQNYFNELRKKLDAEVRQRLEHIKMFEKEFAENKRLLDKKLTLLKEAEKSLEYKKKFINEKEAELKNKLNHISDKEINHAEKEKKINSSIDKILKREATLNDREKLIMEKEKAQSIEKAKFESERKNIKNQLEEKERKIRQQEISLMQKEKELEVREKELNLNTRALDYTVKEYEEEKKTLQQDEFHDYLHKKLNEISSKKTENPVMDDVPKPAVKRNTIYDTIQQCRDEIRNTDFNQAKKLYNLVRQQYYDSHFSKDEEDVIHNEIRKLYDEINIGMLNHG